MLYPPLPHVCPDFRVADATPVRDEIRFVARVTIENAVLNKSVWNVIVGVSVGDVEHDDGALAADAEGERVRNAEGMVG